MRRKLVRLADMPPEEVTRLAKGEHEDPKTSQILEGALVTGIMERKHIPTVWPPVVVNRNGTNAS